MPCSDRNSSRWHPMHQLRGLNDSSGSRNGKAPSGGPDAFDYRGYPDVKHCVNWVGRVVVVVVAAPPLTTGLEALTGKTQAGKKKKNCREGTDAHCAREWYNSASNTSALHQRIPVSRSAFTDRRLQTRVASPFAREAQSSSPSPELRLDPPASSGADSPLDDAESELRNDALRRRSIPRLSAPAHTSAASCAEDASAKRPSSSTAISSLS